MFHGHGGPPCCSPAGRYSFRFPCSPQLSDSGPGKTSASCFALNPDVKLPEVGCAPSPALFETVDRNQSQPHVVLDADDIEENQDGIAAACRRTIGIDFMPSALRREAQAPLQRKIRRKWHADAAGSTGIRKNCEVTTDDSAHRKVAAGNIRRIAVSFVVTGFSAAGT